MCAIPHQVIEYLHIIIFFFFSFSGKSFQYLNIYKLALDLAGSGILSDVFFVEGLYFHCSLSSYLHLHFITPPRNRGGVIFSLQFVCLCVCLSVCLSNRTHKPILTRFSLDSCLSHFLEPY